MPAGTDSEAQTSFAMFQRLKHLFNNWEKNTIINLAKAVTKTLLRVDFHCCIIFRAYARKVNFTCAILIEANCGMSSVDVKIEPRATFTFTCDLSYIASVILTRVKFTCVLEEKLHDIRNPP